MTMTLPLPRLPSPSFTRLPLNAVYKVIPKSEAYTATMVPATISFAKCFSIHSHMKEMVIDCKPPVMRIAGAAI